MLLVKKYSSIRFAIFLIFLAMASTSLCQHLVSAYMTRVEDILNVYESQIVYQLVFEDIQSALLSKNVLKKDEMEKILKMDPTEQISHILSIIKRR